MLLICCFLQAMLLQHGRPILKQQCKMLAPQWQTLKKMLLMYLVLWQRNLKKLKTLLLTWLKLRLMQLEKLSMQLLIGKINIVLRFKRCSLGIMLLLLPLTNLLQVGLQSKILLIVVGLALEAEMVQAAVLVMDLMVAMALILVLVIVMVLMAEAV